MFDKLGFIGEMKHAQGLTKSLPLRGRGTALAVDEEREGLSLFAQIERVLIVSKATSLCKSKNRPPHPPHIRSAPSPLEKASLPGFIHRRGVGDAAA